MTDAERAKVNKALAVVVREWDIPTHGDLLDMTTYMTWVAAWTMYGHPDQRPPLTPLRA